MPRLILNDAGGVHARVPPMTNENGDHKPSDHRPDGIRELNVLEKGELKMGCYQATILFPHLLQIDYHQNTLLKI